jgi:hypothetical protein
MTDWVSVVVPAHPANSKAAKTGMAAPALRTLDRVIGMSPHKYRSLEGI